ncbi:Ornithine carbamoyltransferase [Labeo rohita]|uniref:Ornithine carbamoyltransferase n=1 Tax=Labeo rohita TaxID=84645 RepID=A0ABQ8LBA7_LABRO|nr:Ornithine carbamoyltransferase [Labeo rohita]
MNECQPKLHFYSEDFVIGPVDTVSTSALRYRVPRMRKSGKRAGNLVRFRKQKHRTPLPSTLLSNVHSLANKQDGLTLLLSNRRDVANCSVLCFTETWLNESVPDSRWYTDTKIISTICSTNLELLTIKCRPFHLPGDFTSVILVAVYIPPQAAANEAAQQLTAHIMQLENSYPDSTTLFLGDFNHVDMRKTMPRFKQQVKVMTRLDNILDQSYSVFFLCLSLCVLGSIGAIGP